MLKQQHLFSTVHLLWQKMYDSNGVGLWWVPELPTPWQMLYQLKLELWRPDTFYPMFVNTGCGERGLHYRVFICVVNIQNDTCALTTASYFWLMMNGCSWEIVNFCEKKMFHSRGFQPRTLGFMPNALPFAVHSDLSVRETEWRVSRTQYHKVLDLWSCNQLLVIKFCTSYWYLKIRSQFCTWFGNRIIVLWVKIRINCIIRIRITEKI